MKIIEHIDGNIFDLHIDVANGDYVLMNHDDLFKIHRRLTTLGGESIAISLPEGSSMRDGDILYREGDKMVYISLQPEKVIHIKPQNPMQWAKAAYNIGNMHQTAYLREDGIYVPYDSFIERIMSKLDILFEIKMDKVNGEKANVQNSGHSHGHSHEG